MSTEKLCHCQSQKSFSACCEPFLTKKAFPKTPEELMRSRYSAYVTHNIDYISETHDPDGKGEFDKEAALKWAKDSKWLGLKIISAQGNEVEFEARFDLEGHHNIHHEVSTFRFDEKLKRWFFVDGKLMQTPIQRSEPKLGRNDPCHCGSGKKLKKCHG